MFGYKYTIIYNNRIVEISDGKYSGARLFCGDYGTFVLDDGNTVYGLIIKVELIPTQATRS